MAEGGNRKPDELRGFKEGCPFFNRNGQSVNTKVDHLIRPPYPSMNLSNPLSGLYGIKFTDAFADTAFVAFLRVNSVSFLFLPTNCL